MTTATAAELERLGRARPREPRAGRPGPRGARRRDFYAPVSSLFVADPRRTGEQVLDALLAPRRARARRWLDIGAGAGRYALPLARRVARGHRGRAVGVDAQRAPDRQGGARRRTTSGSSPGPWPAAARPSSAEPPVADVALIAHVGYDIEEIGPFVDAMERAASPAVRRGADGAQPGVGRRPVLADRPRQGARSAAGAAGARRAAPGAAAARRRFARVERAPRTFDSFDGLATFLRRQLWIAEDGEKEQRFRAALAEMAMERDDDGWTLVTPPVGSGRDPDLVATLAVRTAP